MMYIDPTIMFLYMVTVITMIAIPGPVVALVTGAGLTGGPRWAFRTVFGADAASLVLILCSALIIKGMFAVNDTAFNFLKLCGACYIAYIGWSLLHGGSASTDQDVALERPRKGGFSRGFLISISNPKDIIFFASFFPQFMGITASMDASIALLTILWVILDITTLMLIYLLVSRVMNPSSYTLALKCSGIFMILVAAGGVLTCLLEMTGG